MKLKIEKLYRNTENKAGEPFVDKNGAPFTKINILCKDKYYSALDFGSYWKDIKEGDEIEVEVTEKVVGDKTFNNITLVDTKKASKTAPKSSPSIEKRLKRLEDFMAWCKKEIEKKNEIRFDEKNEIVEPADLPF